MENLYQILNFDSELFGFKVAKIIPLRLDTNKLTAILSELKQLQVKLVYWLTGQDDLVTQQAAKLANGILADQKVTFVIDLKTIPQNELQLDPVISEYMNTVTNTALEHLALQISLQSRFKLDPNFPDNLRELLYKKWIANSVNHTLASKVFVYKIQEEIAGMITLGEKNQRGDIGLIAVLPKFRGHNIGSALVRAALFQFIQFGFTTAQVVTQLTNQAACKLYLKNGFHQEIVEYFYHFWI